MGSSSTKIKSHNIDDFSACTFSLILDPHEERTIFSKVIEDIKARSGSKDKIMTYIFQEYFSFPVLLLFYLSSYGTHDYSMSSALSKKNSLMPPFFNKTSVSVH